MTVTEPPTYPWREWPDEIGCNFALGNLVRNIPSLFVVDGKLEADTLMCAAGAVAGWAAQRSLVAQLRQSPPSAPMNLVTTADGRKFLFGDAINNMLVGADRRSSLVCVWNGLAGTAMALGLRQADLPSLGEMFAHVSRTLGSAQEGLPSSRDHQPYAPVSVLLERARPLALSCLTGEIDPVTKANGFAAAETSWQAVTSWMATRILGDCCATMPPGAALTVGMESAIYSSKLVA